MGMYDTFYGKCPNCGSQFESQTKLTDCTMTWFTVGDFCWLGVSTELKEPCQTCNKYITAVVDDNGVLVEYSTTVKPEQREDFFGGTLPEGVSRESREKEVSDWFSKLNKLDTEEKTEKLINEWDSVVAKNVGKK